MVLHSAGGFLGSNTSEGLTTKARSASGSKGGVKKTDFLAARVGPEGFEHALLPFFEFHDIGLIQISSSFERAHYHALRRHDMCRARELLFSDLDEAVTVRWMKEMKTQPAAGWDGTITYCGWREVPSVYLICEGDAVLSAALQMQSAELAGSTTKRCGSGHMVMLCIPEKVVEVVMKAAGGD